jgi:hypothetical protein
VDPGSAQLAVERGRFESSVDGGPRGRKVAVTRPRARTVDVRARSAGRGTRGARKERKIDHFTAVVATQPARLAHLAATVWLMSG